MDNKFQKTAFTLVEVMMVISIIAIISVMIIMTLRQNVGNVEKQAKLNVVRSIITQAVIQYQAENICSGNLATCDIFAAESADAEKVYEEIFKNKMKTQKICGFLIGQGCFSKTEYKDVEDKEFDSYDNSAEYYKVLLQNGIAIGFKKTNSGCEDDICLKFVVDTNGPSYPNILKRDTFDGVITPQLVKINVE